MASKEKKAALAALDEANKEYKQVCSDLKMKYEELDAASDNAIALPLWISADERTKITEQTKKASHLETNDPGARLFLLSQKLDILCKEFF